MVRRLARFGEKVGKIVEKVEEIWIEGWGDLERRLGRFGGKVGEIW